MTLKLMGKKRGMIQFFDDSGNVVVCTIIQVEPNVVTQVKTKESDGYEAIQLGFDEIKTKDPRTVEKRLNKPILGIYKKNNLTPRRHLCESRLDDTKDYTVGQELGVGQFSGLTYLDVTGMSKGKGYQGVMKLHNMAGGPAAHGSSFHRHMGSTGNRSSPGRCFPGGKRASHMGDDQVTIQNVEIFKIIEEDNLIIVKGSIPGPTGALVYVSKAVKLPAMKKAQTSHK